MHEALINFQMSWRLDTNFIIDEASIDAKLLNLSRNRISLYKLVVVFSDFCNLVLVDVVFGQLESQEYLKLM